MRAGGGVGGVGGEDAGASGPALAAFKYSLNTKHLQKGLRMLGAVWAVRARGGPGPHWQPLNTL